MRSFSVEVIKLLDRHSVISSTGPKRLKPIKIENIMVDYVSIWAG